MLLIILLLLLILYLYFRKDKVISNNRLGIELCPGGSEDACEDRCRHRGCGPRQALCMACPKICGTLCGIVSDVYHYIDNEVPILDADCQSNCAKIVGVDTCTDCITRNGGNTDAAKTTCHLECNDLCRCLEVSNCTTGNVYNYSCIPGKSCNEQNCDIFQQERCHEQVLNPNKDPNLNAIEWSQACAGYCTCLENNNCSDDDGYSMLKCDVNPHPPDPPNMCKLEDALTCTDDPNIMDCASIMNNPKATLDQWNDKCANICGCLLEHNCTAAGGLGDDICRSKPSAINKIESYTPSPKHIQEDDDPLDVDLTQPTPINDNNKRQKAPVIHNRPIQSNN